ncbi:AsmA-like C-terminal region-containing protein [Alienimonas sp. DA493]|uniref:AsmA-like C-terminal region-containing protein n=1 Tax=Alienimonas sp. DA493 TaxID=3373605 RepID=UPI003754353D
MIRRTVRWLTALCALLAAGGAGLGWYYLDRADAMTRDAVVEALEGLIPHGRISVATASFNWDETVLVTGLTIAPQTDAEGARPPIVVPEMRIALDRERFRESERIEVRSLTVVRPTLTLVRRPDGTWNLADLLPLTPPEPAPPCPAWEIRDATVRLVFETQPDGEAGRDPGGASGHGPLAATLHQLNVSLLPDSRRSYRIRGAGGVAGEDAAEVAEGGGVQFDGAFDLDRGRWRLAGEVGGLELGGGLLADAAVGSPELQAGLLAAKEKFTAVERKLAGELVPPHADPRRGPVRVVSAQPVPSLGLPAAPAPRGPVRLTDFGLEGDLSAEFALSADGFDAVPEYEITVNCRQGTLVNRFLPFPLSGVRGVARIAEGEVRLIEATGRHGETVARAEGVFRPSPLGLDGRVTFSAERVPVSVDDGPRLPEALRKLHGTLTPSGVLDVTVATLEAAPSTVDGVLRNRWELTELDLAVLEGAIRPEKFPVPVRNVRGFARTDEHGVLRLDFRGTVAGQPAAFRGWVQNPGRAFEFRGAGKVVGAPLNRAFRDACPPPVRAAVEHMALEGLADAELTLHRPPGFDQPFHWTVRADVANAAVRPECFPYPIDGLSGVMRFDSREGVWRFEDLRGAHGPATLTASAAFDAQRKPGRLALDVTAAGVSLDQTLHDALPEGARDVWEELALSGGVIDLRATVAWAPGRSPRVDLPDLRVAGAAITPEAFPLPLQEIEAAGSYVSARTPGGGTLRLQRFAFHHRDRNGEAPVALRTTGGLELRHDAAGDWALSVDDLACDGFVVGPAFKAALSDDLREGAEALNLRGPVGLRVPSLQLRGVADGSAATTAAWRTSATLDGNVAELGPTVRLGRGTVTCEGHYDGERAVLGGELRTDRAELLDHVLRDVAAPFRLRGDELLVGSPDAPDGRRLTAMAYGGVLQANVAANLSRGPSYRLAAELSGAKLSEYARQQMGGAKNLEGNLRGSLALAGRGSDARTVAGSGNLEIKPAALGELNLVLRLFKAVNMNDPTMFHSAAAQFDLANETATFRRIDLLGEAISFVGRGRVGLNGGLDLQFYSKAPTTWRIPLVRALSTGWVGVQVAGTIGQPAMRTFSPAVEGSLAAFLTPLSPLLSEPVPRRTAGGP